LKKSIFFILIIVISNFSSGQTSIKPDYNFGFEKIAGGNLLPENWIRLGTNDFTLKTDLTESHSGTASVSIQSSGAVNYGSFGCVAYSIPAIYDGKKIELRAYLKYQNVENGQVGLMLRIDGERGGLKFDNMQQKNIHGTSDWKEYSIKMSLPKNAATIKIGALLTGSGKLWADDFQLLIDGIDIINGNPKIRKEFNTGKSDEIENISGDTTKFINTAGPENPVIIEKTYLHTDRDTYFVGDDIWFKAYIVDASDRFLSNLSRNLHVELISPALHIVDSRIIRIDEGLGHGDFVVPENMVSGKYLIRAYTNYMRNIGEQLFFNKNITIINQKDALNVHSDSTKSIKNKLEISFFPEGGSLVDGAPSVVAFKAVNAIGIGCDVTGEIYSSAGEIVSIFKSSHKGMGTFLINPAPGLKYYAIARNVNGEEARFEIPKSFPKGLVLNISKIKNNELTVTVRTNPETLSLIPDQILILKVSARNIFLKKAEFRMKSLADRFILPTDDLPDGIVMLTLTGIDSVPLCERLVYIKNEEEVKIKVETEKTVYYQRDSVSVKISVKTNSPTPQNAFLSLSATKNISSKSLSTYPTTISSWFLLESDVHGEVEEPSYYFDSSNPDRLKDLDLLLLTQGWRDFKWKYSDTYWPPEDGFAVSGRIRKKFADMPLKNSRVSIAIFRKGNPIVTTVPADTSGRFSLEGIDLTGEAKLVVSATGEKDRLQGWVRLDSLSYPPAETQKNLLQTKLLQTENKLITESKPLDDHTSANEDLDAYLQYAEIKNSLRNKYKLSDTIVPGEVTVTAKRKFAPESALEKSHHILMANDPDYEYVVTPQAEIFNNLGQLIAFKFFHLTGGSMSGLAYSNPLILLDGMDVGWEGIQFLPVEWIERFDGLRPGSPAAMVWGEKGKGGVISVITRTGVTTNVIAPVYHSASIRLKGYNEPRIFYSPRHYTNLESDYKPDLRTTLFWDPDIKMESNSDVLVNYFNADNPSKVKIVVEGITTSGIPVTAKTEYEVK
jgi:hypothetical protein